MDKVKVSRKKAKSWHPYKITAEVDHLLRYRTSFAYNEGEFGWYCDYYDLGDDIILSVGVAPHGTFVPFPICEKYDTEAYNIVINDSDSITKGQEMNQLIARFKEDLRRL